MSSTAAVYHEIVSSGLQDQALTSPTLDEAVLTFFRFIHMKHTSFALEPIEFQASSGAVQFGSRNVEFKFPRNADLAWATFAKITIPGIVGLDTSGANHVVLSGLTQEPYWTNAIGQYVLEQVKFAVGNTEVDVLENNYMFMWEELSGKPGKRLAEMIGKFDTVALRQAQSRRSRTLYVPLPFYFTENTGLALPIVSLQFHSITFEVDFAQRTNCIVKPENFPASNADVYFRADGTTNAQVEANAIPRLLNDQDISCVIQTYGVYVDFDERSKFSHGQFEQVVTECSATMTRRRWPAYPRPRRPPPRTPRPSGSTTTTRSCST